MHRKSLILVFMIIWVVLTIVALLWGFNYNWPDFVHVDYGLPLSWGTNTLSTIAGPANLWTVNVANLLIDLLFWLGLLIVGVSVLLYKLK